MNEDEPRDWYAQADAYEQRLNLARRITAMVVLTVLAVPLVRVLDDGDTARDSVASGVETTTVAAAPAEPTPEDATAPAAVVTIGPITTGPGAEAGSADRSASVDVDIASLPEITAPADSPSSPSRTGADPSFEDLPEITAPPSATAAPGASATSDDDDQPAASSTPASDNDDEPATTTATTKPPSTTTDEPATTTTAPPPPSYSVEQVQQLIRDTWPDGADEEMALTVAQRESGFRADAVSPTKCCLGIFQIHYEANLKFINALGYNRDDLFDAAKNIRVAYAMWQRSGWSPWSQTAH